MSRVSSATEPTNTKIHKKQEKLTMSLGEKAYVAIKRMILTGELKTGEQLNVTTLTELLDLGRSPVHMAIHRLDREGLVAIIPRKGILVRSETLESFLELIAARQLIEPYLTRQALNHITPQILEKLERLIEQGWEYHRQGNRLGGMEIDRVFHQTLYEISGNSILASFASQLLDRSMVLWFQAPKNDEEQPNVAELEHLLETIKANNSEEAMLFMEKHIASIRKKYLG